MSKALALLPSGGGCRDQVRWWSSQGRHLGCSEGLCCWHPIEVPPGTHHGCGCWPRGGTTVPFLRLALGGVGAYLQRAKDCPGLLQPTHLAEHEATEERSASSCQEGPVSGAVSTWLPFPSALRTPILLLFSHSVMSDFPRTHGLQPIISWCLLKFTFIESMMLSNHLMLCCPFSCPQSFPASGSFPMSWLFPSGGQSIGASVSASVLPMNT